jgi:hypothetical protein
MLVLLQHELDFSDFEQLQEHHPELRDISREDVQAFINKTQEGARD